MAYTPGVARVSSAIAADPEKAWNLTIKQNAVAVVTDGSAVLGLGDIGPEAALPVMEGKAILFKEFGGIDAWPVCLDTKDPDEIVRTVELLAPVFGGVNLEDISAPRCFEIESRLRDALEIPVFHDDQHGTAIVVLAALLNALELVGKRLEAVAHRDHRGGRSGSGRCPHARWVPAPARCSAPTAAACSAPVARASTPSRPSSRSGRTLAVQAARRTTRWPGPTSTSGFRHPAP